ncbi:MAG: recombinase family protein [Jatrophihabitans sp.]
MASTTQLSTATTTSVGELAHALVYLRVSTKRQMDTAIDIDTDGNSISTQRDFTARRAVSVNTQIDQVFIEPGNSAQSIEKRPVFRELLAYVAEHPEVEYVIIYMRSRAFRNFGDAVLTKRKLAALGIKLISAKEDFGEGYMADAMEAVTDIFNEIEVRRNGEDIKAKLRNKAINGGTISRAKIGYLNIRAEQDGRLYNTIGLDPVRAPLVRQAWELYASGDYSIDHLHEAMADLGLMTRPTKARPQSKPISANKLHQMLSDPYYAGWVVVDGQLYPGRHEAIVSQQLFDRVQIVLHERSQRGQRDRVLTHYLKGNLFCDRCDKAGRTNRLIYTEARGRSGDYYGYYICRGRQLKQCNLPHLPVAQVEEAIRRNYTTLQIPTDFATAVTDLLDSAMAEQQQLTHDLHASLTKQLTKLDAREERLIDLAADGALSRTKIHERSNTIRLERARIQASLADTTAELALGADILRTCIKLATDPINIYNQSGDSARRQINRCFYERFYLDDLSTAQRVTVVRDVLRPPFDEIREAANLFTQALETAGSNENGPNVAAGTIHENQTPLLADIFRVRGSSKRVVVELRGFEPLAPSMRTLCGVSRSGVKSRRIPL